MIVRWARGKEVAGRLCTIAGAQYDQKGVCLWKCLRDEDNGKVLSVIIRPRIFLDKAWDQEGVEAVFQKVATIQHVIYPTADLNIQFIINAMTCGPY